MSEAKQRSKIEERFYSTAIAFLRIHNKELAWLSDEEVERRMRIEHDEYSIRVSIDMPAARPRSAGASA